jgi:predicted nucleic acid-binding Zn ribbon protein
VSSERRRPPKRVGEVLPGVAEVLGLGPELRLARAMATWTRLVEERVPAAAGASRMVEVRGALLVVSADDAATGQELRLRADELLGAFAAAPGGIKLRELRVVVRPGSGAGRSPRPRVD